MNEQHNLRYFLGGNTSQGFYSLYDSFVSQEDGDFLWIIKGGPGCGKSSFMKKIGAAAESAGLNVEYVSCSSDPDSLDGVFIPALNIAYMDGTAPHIADANIAAADSSYIDLGAFYNNDAIAGQREELGTLSQSIFAMYKRAYAILAAAGSFLGSWQNSFVNESERQAANRRIQGIAAREFGKRRDAKEREGFVKRRFLSAVTCKGIVAFPETARILCERFYLLDNRLCLGEAALTQAADAAVSAGYDVFLCPNPLIPDVPEAVLIPELSLGFIVSTSALSVIRHDRRIRLDALVSSERMRAMRHEIRRCEKISEAALENAVTALSEAKSLHEKKEKMYNPHVDFKGVYALAEKHILALGL